MSADRIRADRMRAVRLLLPLCVAACLLSSSCSAGDSDGEGREADGVPAAELCHASLNPAARRALDTLSRDKSFQQAGDLSFAAAGSKLRRSEEVLPSRTTVCRVYSPHSSAEDPLFEVEFAHLPADTRWERKEEWDTDYPMGEFARAHDGGATLSFRCDTGLAGSTSPGLAGALYAQHTDAHATVSDAARSSAAMTILHSVTLSMAETMGCGAEAKLPERLPAPVG